MPLRQAAVLRKPYDDFKQYQEQIVQNAAVLMLCFGAGLPVSEALITIDAG